MSDATNRQTFAKNLQYFMDVNQKSRKDICNALKINYSTLGEWLRCSKYPRIDKIELLSRYFNISKSDLIEPRINTTVTGDNNSTATTGTISNSTINGTINTGTINGNIITPSATENDTCQMYHALSAEAKGQIDNLVKMLHDMENKK